MATKTEIYELRKKEENDFYNVEDFNNNMDTLEKALTEFDDSGTAEGVTSFPEMLTKLVTGNKLAITLKNLKAGLQFVLHAGSIVNNCVTDNANLPVSAAMAKSLQDQINQANSNFLTVEYNSIITISTLKTWTESSYEITSPPVGFSFNDIVSITAFSQKDHWEKWLRLVVNQQAAGRGVLAIIGYGINRTGQIPITIRVCYKK